MVGIETLAIVVSSTCMKVPSASAVAISAREPMASGAAVAAVALNGRRLAAPRAPPLLAMTAAIWRSMASSRPSTDTSLRGVSRTCLATSGPDVSCRSMRRLHRQADAQRMVDELGGIQRDAHRHALHDLDPVAAGVLRRQQCEGAAAAGAQSGDVAVKGDTAAIDIRLQLDRLADAHARQLHFLEVRVDPGAGERDHRHQRSAGRNARADLHCAPRDRAVRRRDDRRAIQIQSSFVHPGRCGQHLRMRFECRVVDLGVHARECIPGRAQRRFELRDLIVAMLQLFSGHRAAVAGLHASLHVRPCGVEQQLAFANLGAQAVSLRVERANLAHRARQFGLRRCHRDLRVGPIQLDEELTAVHVLSVVHHHATDGAGDLAGDLHDIGGDVCVVGRFVEAAVEELIRAVRSSEDEDGNTEDYQPSLALAGCGFVDSGGFWRAHHGAPVPAAASGTAGSKLPPSMSRRFMRARRRLLSAVTRARRASSTRDSASSTMICVVKPAA